MKEPTELQQQQYQRYIEILEMGQQRYFEVTGKGKGYRAGLRGQDYLSDEERVEVKRLLKQMFDTSAKQGYAIGLGETRGATITHAL